MANIEKRNGTYRVKVRLKGHPTQTATFQTRTEAKRWAQGIESTLREGRRFPTTEVTSHTLAELIDRYLVDVLPHKSAASIETQTIQLTYWRTHFGRYSLSNITPGLIAEHRDLLARTRKNSTVRRYLAALSHTFTIAIKEYQWLEDNPCRRVRKPPEPCGRVRFLSEEEIHRLLDACLESRNPHLHTVVVLALSTGARKMELLKLRWPDVDLKRDRLILRRTKNGETRSVPIVGYARDIMGVRVNSRRSDTGFVFIDSTGRRSLCIRNAFNNAVERAGIKDFRFHDLRHTAASHLAMNGSSLLEIAAILGHKSLEMVKRYSHLSESHTAGIVARMNKAIFGE